MKRLLDLLQDLLDRFGLLDRVVNQAFAPCDLERRFIRLVWAAWLRRRRRVGFFWSVWLVGAGSIAAWRWPSFQR